MDNLQSFKEQRLIVNFLKKNLYLFVDSIVYLCGGLLPATQLIVFCNLSNTNKLKDGVIDRDPANVLV